MNPLVTLVLGVVIQFPTPFDLAIALLDHDDFTTRTKAQEFLNKEEYHFQIRAKLQQPLPIQVKQTLENLKVEISLKRMIAFYDTFNDFPMYDAWFYDIKLHGYWRVGFWGMLDDVMRPYYDNETAEPHDARPYSRYRMATRAMFMTAYDNGVPLFILQLIALEMYRVDYHFLKNDLEYLPDGSTRLLEWQHPWWFPEIMKFEHYDLVGLHHVLCELQKHSE